VAACGPDGLKRERKIGLVRRVSASTRPRRQHSGCVTPTGSMAPTPIKGSAASGLAEELTQRAGDCNAAPRDNTSADDRDAKRAKRRSCSGHLAIRGQIGLGIHVVAARRE
jgi:hypothetical protein